VNSRPVKTALVVEGGGLRGAFPAGVLQVLLARFGADAFDGIFAVSSGVFASTFFLAGQGAEMEEIWRNRVCGHQLVDHRNWFRRRPVLRLDYLVELFQGPARLDLDRVMSSRPYLEYVLSDHDTGRPVYVDAKRRDIFDLMRASSALPHIYPLPVRIAGRNFYDGGQSDPIPLQRAIDFGATRIVVVRTRPAGYTKKPMFPWSAHTGLQRRYNDTVRLIEQPSSTHSIVSFNPVAMFVGRLTRDQGRITAAIDHGKEVASRIIDAHPSFFEAAFAKQRVRPATNDDHDDRRG
jgi:predicted patatin/cPLA2 family phospholipase